MELKRRIALVTAIFAVAIGAGHIAQNGAKKRQDSVTADQPKDVVQLAAGAETAPPARPMQLPAVSVAEVAAPAPALEPVSAPEPAIVIAAVAPDAPAVLPPVVSPPLPNLNPVANAPVAAPSPAATPTVAVALAVADVCALTFDVMAAPSAMIGLSLVAPCHANERIVLRHAGLAVTGRTTATGSIFTALPALEKTASVSVLFADGTTADASLDMPEVATLTRFAVQWQADDAFQIHAFEGGAGYGQPGHVSAADPQTPTAGIPPKGGFLLVLGDSTVDNPLLAEVYTFPMTAAAKTEVLVETAVTSATCGRELLGETLTSAAGKVFVTDLTVAMPDCTALGDFLVLKNLVPDLTLASAK